MNIKKEQIEEVLHYLSFGLTKGLGKQEKGKMCIEAMISTIFDKKFDDRPSCVGDEVSKTKIKLNDCAWSSNNSRAEGMKKIAIAQIGSVELDQKEFRERLKLKSLNKTLPYIIQKHYEECKNEKLLEYKSKFEQLTEVDRELWKEFYSKYNYYYYYYYYYYYNYNYYYYNFGDEYLLLVADIILQVLINMKSPGCEWLYMVEES